MGSDKNADILRGKTLEVYHFLLKSNKPISIREVQRALNFSSPSLVIYHFSKLEEAGIVKKEKGEYTVSKVLLEHSIRINRFLIPRFFFYSVFVVAALIIELTYLRPQVFTSAYFFAIIVTFMCALAFCYETAKTLLKSDL